MGEHTITFARPDESTLGSGLTYIVGENNTGKTSILEGMHFLEHYHHGAQSQLRTSDIKGNPIHFTFYNINNEPIHNLIQFREGSYSLKNDVVSSESSNFVSNSYPIFIPARRYWSPTVLNDMDINSARLQPYGHNAILRQSMSSDPGNQIADLFHAIERDDQSYDLFISTMRKVFQTFHPLQPLMRTQLKFLMK